TVTDHGLQFSPPNVEVTRFVDVADILGDDEVILLHALRRFRASGVLDEASLLTTGDPPDLSDCHRFTIFTHDAHLVRKKWSTNRIWSPVQILRIRDCSQRFGVTPRLHDLRSESVSRCLFLLASYGRSHS